MGNIGRATLVALSILASSVVSGQVIGQNLSVSNYQIVSQLQGPNTQVNVTYRADLFNSGPALGAVTATVSSIDPFSIRVVPGQDTLHFPPVPANGHVTSIDTFTVVINSGVSIDFSKLQWSFQSNPGAPVANPGPNQTSKVGATVILDGSASTNPSGVGTLTYSWAFASRPSGSSAKLSNPTGLMASFVIDVAGDYVITLTVSNGLASSSANVTVTTNNTPPVAKAGPNQTVPVGTTVHLDGSASSDADGNPLTFVWTLTAPAGSAATLTGATTPTPTFVVDKPGSYVAQLIVNDGTNNSVPSTVTINTPPQNSPPTANPGPNQVAKLGDLIQLNGSASTDPNGLPLTYMWVLITRPSFSTATLSSSTAVNPFFSVDLAGDYVIQLTVSNGTLSSAPKTLTVTTNPPQPPVAHAGANQTVALKSVVTLNGSGTDPQGLPLTLKWSLTSKPAGSTAVLSSTSAANPTFTADKAGTYIAQLIVNNGFLDSPAVTVMISTINNAPVADAGKNQNVAVGATVILDGSASSSSNQNPLTYSWSLTKPAGSNATLTGANTVAPTFVADVAGVYVAQLIVNDGVQSSAPATVMITAAAATNITLSPDPLSLSGGNPGILTVKLPAPAGASGQVVNLVSSNTGVATVPATITVPANAIGANVAVTPVAFGTTTITASAAGLTNGTATVNVVQPSITVALDNGTVGVSHTINGTVTLNAPAQAGGITVNLTASPGGIVTIPATVMVPGGSSSAAFMVTGVAAGAATITATAQGYNNGSVNVNVGLVGAIVLASGVTVGPNQSVPIPVNLVTPAPTGGVTIALSSSDPNTATVTPSTVFIAFGKLTPDVQPQVNGINFGTVTVSASAPGFNGDSQQVVVNGSITLTPMIATVPVGVTQNLTLTLSSPAPAAGLTLNLSSSNPAAATVPATLAVPANAVTANVPVTGVAPGSAVIHANGLPSLADTTANVNVVAQQPINLQGGVTVGLGQSTNISVSLPNPAPANTTITLVSSDPSKVTVTASVVIPKGSMTPATQPMVTGLSVGSANITASAPGFAPATQSVSVTGVISFAGPVTVTAGGTQNLTLNLSGPAPAGGLTVDLISSNTGVATVPATASFAAAATSVQVPVTGVGAGTTTVTASSAGLANATANVTVAASASIILASNVSIGLGQSAPFPVTLTTPAPATLTVTLTNSDPTKVSLPASVTIPQGATAPVTQPTITGLNLGSVNIGATAPGYTSATQAVQVTGSINFAGGLTVNPGSSANLTLNLSGPAPAGGLSISIGSNNIAAATVPPTVVIPANATSVLVPVQGIAQGSATITASAPNLASTTAIVSVGSQPPIILPTNTTVALGQSATFAVTLSAPAPAALTVMLVSSDPTKVSVPASVNIAQGATTPAVQPQVTGLNVGSANITASASGYTQASQPVVVTASLTFTGGLSVNAGSTANLTLNLSGPAPAGGLTVNLTTSNAAAATVPATVVVPATQTSVQVPVTGVSQGSAIITASATGVASAAANVNVAPIPSLLLPASLTVGVGQSVSLGLALPAPAASQVTLTLVSSDVLKATVTSPVVIPAGATTPVTQAQINGISPGTVTINVSAPGYAAGNVVVTVGAPNITVQLDSASLGVTHTINGTFSLGTPAPAQGVVVTLASSPGGIVTIQPNMITVPGGSSTGFFTVTGVGAGVAAITASAPGYSNGANSVTVSGLGAISLPTGVVVGLGQSVPFPITLVTAAPVGGVTITLTSSDPTKVTISPDSVFIPFRSTTPAVQPQVTGVAFGTASITASAPGFTSDTKQVKVGASISFTPPSLAVGLTTTQNLTLTMSSPAPAGGTTVNLSSSNPAVATVPATVVFPANATTVSVPVTGVSAGSATIHASGLPDLADTAASVTVFSFGSINLQSNVLLGVSQSQQLQLSLSSPAPAGGVTVTLVSSDPSKVLVTSSVFIPQGAQTTFNLPMVTGVGSGSSTITAKAPGYLPASQVVQVAGFGF